MNEVIELLLRRRSIRSFLNRPVDTNLIKDLIRVANHAPSSMNREPWKFIVITDPSIKERLSKLHDGARHLAKAPVAIAVVAEPDVSPETWMVDVVNATMYFVVAAYSVGLAVAWVAAFENETAKEILGIPKEKKLITLLSVGYPDPSYEVKPKAVKAPEEVTFLNRYGNPLG
ncbi:MAG: nitroreductase family protein [Sulfolobales archaeon]|nr:nitroreductase family protein [Sulfolobales archaeon]MCG2884302.1 nitroreductase family protein [Sulfolobales archaeon]MCG2908693.1 nitroreductase family protein [Sulfolobales archaeon]